MNAVDIIVKKRDGQELCDEDITYFIDGMTSGEIPDYQVAAWAMAVYFQGMTDAETTALTLAMAASGNQLDLRHCKPSGSKTVDKHSSGGVGDKTTLVVGPIVAACALPVGKMSGRGLSHTGGTIDKLESISGWSAQLSEDAFCRQLREIGLVVAEQTAELAPADKTLYALRDVTGTVPSLPLIASSIVSKKLAAGADAIVVHVKCGSGAFMKYLDEAERLAKLMVTIGERAGRDMTALITQMDQPLGRAVGNTLEVQEAIATLRGQGPDDFTALVEAVASEMLILGAKDDHAISNEQALARVRAAITSAAAYEKFKEFVEAQGGDTQLVDNPELLPIAPVVMDVEALQTGEIASIDSQEIGLAALDLGGGRRTKTDTIDHGVGIVLHCKVADAVATGEALATLYARDIEEASAAADRIRSAFTVVKEKIEPLPVVYKKISLRSR